MSKTATLAFTRYGKKQDEDTASNQSHYLINVPLQPQTSVKTRHKTAEEGRILTRTTGYRLGEGREYSEMSKRSSSGRNNKNSLDVSRSNNQRDGVKKDNLISTSKKSSSGQASKNQQQQVGRENGQVLGNPSKEEKKSMESYFQDHGVNLHKVKKNCKIYNKEEWEGGQPRRGGLYLSTFSPPSGFSREDIPESQGMSQPLEEPISPAVRIANQLQKEREIRRIRKASEGDDCSDVIRRLKETRRNHLNQNQITEAIVDSQVNEELNITFPEDDSFSDSFLIRASQQVEDDPCVNNKEWLHNEENKDIEGRKRDINGNSRKVTDSSLKSKESMLPFTSTPISESEFGVQKLAPPPNETPKGRVLGLSRARNRSAGQSNSSLFECSSENLETKSNTDETEETPRKFLKFDESPIKGDFNDDEDDVIFSQIELPVDALAHTRSVNNKSTIIITDKSGNDTDSFLRPEMLLELEKLEGMAIQSLSSSSSIDNKNSSETSVAVHRSGSYDEDTPRRSRRQGLSRRVKK